MFNDLLRIIGVALVGLILILPSGDYLNTFEERTTQAMIGLVVVATILFIDAIFGALLGLTVLIWFFRMNHYKMVAKALASGNAAGTPLPAVYGTAQNLLDAQSNIVDEKMANTEMIGFDGVYGEQVIGAQGLDKEMPGFDKNKADMLAPITSD